MVQVGVIPSNGIRPAEQLEKPVYKLKSCPRCRGDLAHESDRYGAMWVCCQCGMVEDIPPAPRVTSGQAVAS